MEEKKEGPLKRRHDSRDGERDSFLTLNSPIPPDATDGTGGETATVSQIGGVFTQRVWSRNLQGMLDHVTRDWRSHYVTSDVLSSEDLREFAVRPFVLVVKLDAPILDRFRRMTRDIDFSPRDFCDGGLTGFTGWPNTASLWRNSSSNTTQRYTGYTYSNLNQSTGVRRFKS
jgi:hypothetical protein